MDGVDLDVCERKDSDYKYSFSANQAFTKTGKENTKARSQLNTQTSVRRERVDAGKAGVAGV